MLQTGRLILLLLFLTGCTVEIIEVKKPIVIEPPKQKFGATRTITDDTSTKEAEISSAQEAYKDINGKYQYQAAETIGDFTIQIDEYVAENGIGYHVRYYKTVEGDGVYMKSFGEGVESARRNHDWKLIKDLTASSTKE